MANAQGFVTVEIAEEEYRIEYSNSDLADADEYMMEKFGRSFVAQLQTGDMNFHIARIAFYFGCRRHAKDVRSVKQAGLVLDKADNIPAIYEAIGRAQTEALRKLGLIAEELETEENEAGE